MAGSSHRTAQPPTLAAFRPWEGSAGAGRVRPAGAKIRKGRRNTFNVPNEVVVLAVNRGKKDLNTRNTLSARQSIQISNTDQFICSSPKRAEINQDGIAVFCIGKITFGIVKGKPVSCLFAGIKRDI